MALIKCPECNKEISNTANICIHCGYKLNSEPQSVQLTHDKMKSAKKALTKGITIFLTLSVITLLFLLIDHVLPSVITYTSLFHNLNDVGQNIMKLLPFVYISPVLSIIMLAIPQIRKIWAVLIYLIINIISIIPSFFTIFIVSTEFLGVFLGILIGIIAVPIMFIIGLISVIKGMIQKD